MHGSQDSSGNIITFEAHCRMFAWILEVDYSELYMRVTPHCELRTILFYACVLRTALFCYCVLRTV